MNIKGPISASEIEVCQYGLSFYTYVCIRACICVCVCVAGEKTQGMLGKCSSTELYPQPGLSLEQWFLACLIPFPRGYLAMCGDTFGCHNCCVDGVCLRSGA
jgi:hypothetical protein